MMEQAKRRVHPIKIEPPILLQRFRMIFFRTFNKTTPSIDSAIKHLPRLTDNQS
jgi:hypothetical protein